MKTSQKLLSILQISFFAAAILYFGKVLFIPLCFGLLIAFIVYPFCKWLENRGWPKTLSIAAALSIVVILFTALIFLFTWQVRVFQQDLPALTEKLKVQLPNLQLWLEKNWGISTSSQQEWLHKMFSMETLSGYIRVAFNGLLSILFNLFLVPVFAALFLYNRVTFFDFLVQVSGPVMKPRLKPVLLQATHTYFKFIKGMVLVYLIVGVLNSIGLMALGIKHAILFGMLTAIMTIIPYVGIIVSALLPISVAWLTKDSIWYPLAIVAIFAFVQYLEANIIFPTVVGAQLNISTWATLVAILAGGILWGVSGMILFIPFLAITKIMTDDIAEWKALNILLSR